MSITEMIKVILLDIEGTTAPIDFVHKTLFPFAKNRIAGFVKQNFDELKDEIAHLETEYRRDFLDQIYDGDFDKHSPQSVSQYLKFLIEADRKSTPLKSIQGKIWKDGYETGELKAEIYADVPKAFERWKTAGKLIAIYSSGSVLAQKLLFKYTDCGDLTEFISHYFDTNTGGKKDSASYGKIAFALGFPPVENLFISDVTAELDAAKKAGMQTLLSVREGNKPIETGANLHQIIHSFDEID